MRERNEVFSSVSRERSAEKRSASTETIVRQQPLTAMLAETDSLPAREGALTAICPPPAARRSASIVPRCSMIPVNIRVRKRAFNDSRFWGGDQTPATADP